MNKMTKLISGTVFSIIMCSAFEANAGAIFPKAEQFFKAALPAAAQSAIGRMEGLGAMPIPSGQGSSPLSLIQNLGKMNGMMASPSFQKFLNMAMPKLTNFGNIQNMIMGKLGINPSAILGGMGINLGSLMGGIVQNENGQTCVIANNNFNRTIPSEVVSRGHLLANPIVSSIAATPIAAGGGGGIFPDKDKLNNNGQYNPEGDGQIPFNDPTSGPSDKMDTHYLQ